MKIVATICILLAALANAKTSVRGPRGSPNTKQRRLKKDKKLTFGIPGLVQVQYKTPGPRKNCLGEETLLYSCLDGEYIEARHVQVGDSLRTMTTDGSVCSDVYYKFEHQGKDNALAFTVEGSEQPLVLSDSHIVYVGEVFGGHQAVRAENIKVGDKLVTRDGPSMEVLSIEVKRTNFVNILTYNPSLELESGVVISAHSYDETLYSILFAPFKLMYMLFGGKYMNGVLKDSDTKVILAGLDYFASSSLDIIS
eukprot:CAMPEP_0194223368 /NCGR_PEP_ID=MMETSP0156-20130528/34992_1 /TAXON_ID=33649 /ORGANISM="Thalassionema nitzschioides, Strain L26-B" /LENGTH=252 /DNA_ID=CAMNT_0038954481 /DNA_START=96 /DNA_END=854 /DNA_ORIENTATION=+